jgi:serine/threonine protein kinase
MPLDLCPDCGAQLTNGLCPRCLVKLAIEGDPIRQDQPTEPDPQTTQANHAGPAAPKADAAGDWTPAPTDQTIDRSPRPETISEASTVDGGAKRLAPGTTVRYFGDYEIQKELGRGGMGVVYKAMQVSLNRPVAIKMIKAGVLADDAELRRFQNEAEAVALLDHPGIVPVYEVGEHDGQRYFSMKLVEGGNLAGQLPMFKTNPRAAAALLAETAEAVHHAHMRGILHRDLKPANILIDAEGHPHVTDFGLAKRVEADIEMTASGAILGTPAYMSPEQANGRRGSITTATDVYGLGATLYAMLAGKAPFGGDSVIETLDAVRIRPPEPPRKFNAKVPRDLETICLKCLEKDPRRRYASAHELADDLNNWLDSRPITARRVSASERAWLWCKRKPAVAALAASVLLAVVVGTGSVFAVQTKANRLLKSKNDDLTQANTKVKQANADLKAANARERERFNLAMGAIKTFHTGVSEDLLLKQREFQELRNSLLGAAAKFYRQLETQLQGQTDRTSRIELAQAYDQLGNLTRVIGSKDAALADHRSALSLREELSRESGSDIDSQVDLGLSEIAMGKSLRMTGGWDEALKTLEKARNRFMGLAAAYPAQVRYRELQARSEWLIGTILNESNHKSESLIPYGRALAIYEALEKAEAPRSDESRMDQATVHNNAGNSLRQMGREDKALAEFNRARTIQKSLIQANPSAQGFQTEAARTIKNIATCHRNLGHPDESLLRTEEARDLYWALSRANPAVGELRSELAFCELLLGVNLNETGRNEESLAHYGRAKELFIDLVRAEAISPSSPLFQTYRTKLATVHNNTGNSLRELGRMTDAMKEYDQARVIQEGLVRETPGDPYPRHELARILSNTGDLHARLGDPNRALADIERGCDLEGEVVKLLPEEADCREKLVHLLSLRAALRHEVGQPAARSLVDFRRAVAIRTERPSLLSSEYYQLACVHSQFSSFASKPSSGLSALEARAEADRAMDALRRAVALGYRNLASIRADRDLAAIRDRVDFKLLMMDLAMPKEAFKK